MENDCTVNIVSLEKDRDVSEASAESQSESTLSNSLDSGVTAETSRSDADSKLDECTAWTNEKHNSYLDYLESSFVRQLYSLLGGGTQRLSRTRDVQSNSHKSADQFTVLQNGCWQKVNFGKKQSCLETSSEFRFHRNSLRNKPENSNGNYTMGTTVQGDVLCHDETKHSEASGQNFREEEEEEEKGEVSKKREREANNDDSSLKEDQVVPVRMVKPRT
ncbi:hypothetical protein ISN44_As04g035570 [Arabidopsis suecica]|jgi:hypothetical protein|uniref:Cold-regulated protein 28 n=4 Tax=Arabidopsis TaxID=3701 RepID=COR28_ARATH|nr:uncharacterized protein AT4G33980 [Arabidopsis thaliana]Q8L983.1 RecName: Full=Cold-regulated protein 28 [Arabidopsis thaliana]KAG7622795.1 hypothetical protein ISN44_As04g035570 [Arabidopsis suecica]AAM66115.1 unknown [Arabidopsis thaliana]ABD43007.1 At4g33980 [Arabidopsis thaliana]AEE86303.1 hypothetical protein AT4G33980 [Arabidopsis thaliana]CAA0397421.1 unnamed protein product [Arabidopsis thaliana]|eukprot:NP_567946.1 hypothetical protein AT4G33980 [Arabidopsis thaliana]